MSGSFRCGSKGYGKVLWGFKVPMEADIQRFLRRFNRFVRRWFSGLIRRLATK